MRTTVLIAFAIGAGLTLAALSMAANGFTVWTGVWIVACGLAGTGPAWPSVSSPSPWGRSPS